MLAVARERVAARGLGARSSCDEGRAEALPFPDALVRRPDRHVPAPLRRRSGRDDPGARPRRATGRDDGDARLRRPAGARGSRSLGALRADRAAARRTSALARLARGGTLPRPEHPRPRGAPAARAPARAVVGGRARRTCARGGSASAAAWSCGAGADERRAAAGLLCARAGRLARLRDAAPPALHALASLLRRDRGGAGARSSRPTACSGGSRLPARPRRRRPRARRAARPPAAARRSRASCSSGSPPLSRRRGRDRDRRRARVDALAAAVRRRRSVPRPRVHAGARSGPSSTRDLWFGLAWGAFPVLVAYLGAAETLRPEASSRLRSRCSRAWRSARSRPRCGRCGAGSHT